ncbi:hypothetical protein E2320_022190 [Naja naja]|nr:hypothetical protein E2320_022190 [Naja naja]
MTGLPLLLLLLLFWLLPPMAAEKTQTICVSQKGLNLHNQWEYYRPGDVVIGGNLPLAALMRSTLLDFQNHPLLLSYNIAGVYALYQLGVGFDFAQGDRRVYPSFFQINPKEFVQSEGLVQLLLHFHWNWVGLMANQDEGGERFISSLVPMLKKKEICLAFTEMMKSDFSDVPYTKLNHIFNTWSKGEVIILYGDSSTFAYVQKWCLLMKHEEIHHF